MTVRLRPHHLLCVLTYVGRGYTPAFTANLTAIAARLAAGEEVEIVDGPDAVCAPLLDDPEAHCYRSNVLARDQAAANEIGERLTLTIRPGTRLVLDAALIRRLRRAFTANRVRSACDGCAWRTLCGTVATSGYAGTTL